MAFDIGNIEKMSQRERDQRIRELHQIALSMWPQIESIIDELKFLGPHSLDRDNALQNTKEWLDQLSRR